MPVTIDLAKDAQSRYIWLQDLGNVFIPVLPACILAFGVVSRRPAIVQRFMDAAFLPFGARIIVAALCAYASGLLLSVLVFVLIETGTFRGAKIVARWIAVKDEACLEWRDPTWQGLARSFLGTELTPQRADDPTWETWYELLRRIAPGNHFGYSGMSVLLRVVHHCAYAITIVMALGVFWSTTVAVGCILCIAAALNMIAIDTIKLTSNQHLFHMVGLVELLQHGESLSASQARTKGANA